MASRAWRRLPSSQPPTTKLERSVVCGFLMSSVPCFFGDDGTIKGTICKPEEGWRRGMGASKGLPHPHPLLPLWPSRIQIYTEQCTPPRKNNNNSVPPLPRGFGLWVRLCPEAVRSVSDPSLIVNPPQRQDAKEATKAFSTISEIKRNRVARG